MKKFFKWLVIVVIILLAVFFIGKDAVIKSVIESGAKNAVGMDLTIDRMGVGIFNTAVSIEGLKVENPPGFGGGDLLSAPEVFVDYDILPFLSGNVHLPEIRLHVQELNIVQDREGKLNIEAFGKEEKEKPAPSEKKKEPGEKKPEKKAEFRVDLLKLRIDNVSYLDLATGKKEVYDLGVDEEFKNITDPRDIARVVILTAVQNNLVRRATGRALGDLSKKLGLKESEMEGLTEEAGGLLKSILGD